MTRTRYHAIRTAALALLVMAASGCDSGLTDLNRNPNSPDRATAEQLFPNAVEAAVSRTFGSSLHMDMTSLWAQHFAEFLYTQEDVYEVSDGAIGGHWAGYYVGPLQDLQEVVEQGQVTGRANVSAIGSIMQSWTFHVMTDLWGDIGYSDALRGREADAGNTPTFDTQEQVYNGILDALADASAALQPGQPGFAPARADLIYNSDIAKWQRFANSLRLRVAMRMSLADEAQARTVAAAAVAAGVFTSNADNAMLRYVNDEVSVNPLYSYQRSRDDHGISATMVDTLASLADPRLAIYAMPNARTGAYVGTQNGSMRDPPLDSVSRIGAYFARADAPAVLMSYAEVLFLQAEAVERGWISGNAADLYRSGITASMQSMNIAQSAIDAYLAQPQVAYAGLPSIGLQKWIALYGNGVEAYAEVRRTGYPNLVAGPDAGNDGLMPVRLPYPTSEGSRNGTNLQLAKDRQSGAGLNSLLWWDR